MLGLCRGVCLGPRFLCPERVGCDILWIDSFDTFSCGVSNNESLVHKIHFTAWDAAEAAPDVSKAIGLAKLAAAKGRVPPKELFKALRTLEKAKLKVWYRSDASW
jgi:hypothetical protein